jgi:hypothetical protein
MSRLHVTGNRVEEWRAIATRDALTLCVLRAACQSHGIHRTGPTTSCERTDDDGIVVA